MPTGQKRFCSFAAESSTLMELQLFLFFSAIKIRLSMSEGDFETIRIFCTEFKPCGKWPGHFCSRSFPPKPLCIKISRRIFDRKVAHPSVLLDGHQQGKDKTCNLCVFRLSNRRESDGRSKDHLPQRPCSHKAALAYSLSTILLTYLVGQRP